MGFTKSLENTAFSTVLRERSSSVTGILNGVDYNEWNPERDAYIARQFSISDLEGKRLWAKFVEAPRIGFGHAASPLLIDGKLIIHLKDLVALDIATGKELWTHPPDPGAPAGLRSRRGGGDIAGRDRPAGAFDLLLRRHGPAAAPERCLRHP